MNKIEELINLGYEENGYLEKSRSAYNENPDIIYEKFDGAGYDNITKYAKEMDDLGVYNGIKNGYPWCKVFIDWLFVKIFGEERASELLLGWTAGVTQFYNWASDNDLVRCTPDIGDLVIFGDCDHIGLVVDISDGAICTIEGNTNEGGYNANGGAVCVKWYDIDSGWIKCYVEPEYNEEPPEPTPSGDEQIREIQIWCNSYGLNIAEDGEYGPETKRAITKVYQIELNEQYGAELKIDGIFGPETKRNTPIVGYGALGNITKSIQSILYCRGYSTDGVNGYYSDGTVSAIKAFQSNHNLDVDGIYGPETGYVLFN